MSPVEFVSNSAGIAVAAVRIIENDQKLVLTGFEV